jgi:hypothetical protein
MGKFDPRHFGLLIIDEARQLIAEIFRRWDGELCSFKQARVLKKYGYDANVSRQEAAGILDALARNGWKREVLHELH